MLTEEEEEEEIVQIQDTVTDCDCVKILNFLELDMQNYFKQKSVGAQPCSPREIILNGL